jgi:L-ribulokinase
MKLWKHHAAQPVADRMNETARARGESWLDRYGGRLSSEWYFPKLIEIGEQDPDVYGAAAHFVEVTDWVVWQLTGRLVRTSCAAGYKALWSPTEAFPTPDYFAAVSSVGRPWDKLGTEFHALGESAGLLSSSWAGRIGLPRPVPVAVGNVDAMVSVPAVGVERPEVLVMVMGTSICHLTIAREEIRLPGVTGVVKDGVLPDWYGYEAGQAAVGDMFGWFVRTLGDGASSGAQRAAQFERLEREAGALAPGESGLLALDWWNGNRSILADADLSGVMMGLTVTSTPAEMYRALLEATAMGTRRIVDNFNAHTIPIRRLVAVGGLPMKSPLLMQIYADVTGLPVVVPDALEVPARGSALFGAVAAGRQGGGFDTIAEAARALVPPIHSEYHPVPHRHAVYEDIYKIHRRVHDWLGTEAVDNLHGLKAIRRAHHQP